MKTMASFSSSIQWPASLLLLSLLCPFSLATTKPPPSPIKAVNLGGWLVVEGWMTPWLFNNMPSNDLLDSTQVQFKSLTLNKYLTAENGGGAPVVANRDAASGWETFKLWREGLSFQFEVSTSTHFIGLPDGNNQVGVVAAATSPATQETFRIVRKSDDLNSGDSKIVRLQAPNGLFVQVKTDGSVTADAQESNSWDNSDPSVFMMTILDSTRRTGEIQLITGYGKDQAAQVLMDHWNNYIKEEDFVFMAQNGINAVRIPIGYWIVDANPPEPFLPGSRAALDRAFDWAENQGIKVIVDLHAALGSQNGNDHSASRDGSQEWGKTDKNIAQTVSVIDALASRYAQRPSFLAMELINEPLAPGVTLENLKKYYKDGYDAVRKYSSTCYVIMSNRLGPADPTELLDFAGGLGGTVIDVHYYNLYSDTFKQMSLQQNIDYVRNDRAAQLKSLMRPNGPLIFVGEWTAELDNGISDSDAKSFAAAELDVFSDGTFGWAYWSLKNVNNHWSLEYMMNNGLISLKN